MKRKLFTYLKVIVAVFILSSCSEDDKDIIPDGTLSLYGSPYRLNTSVLWHSENNVVLEGVNYIYADTYKDADGNDVSDEIHGFTTAGEVMQTGNFIVSLYGEGISYNKDFNKAVGEGTVLTIQFSSQDLTELVEGTYTYSESKEANSFVAYISSSYDFNAAYTYNAGFANRITEGFITVNKQGNGYEFDFNCKTSTGSVVSGKYSGENRFVDLRKEVSLDYLQDVKMEAVFNSKNFTESGWYGDYSGTEEDIDATAVFNFSIGGPMQISGAIRMNETEIKNIELALCYNRETNSILFKSPIELRSHMWRGMGYYPDVRFPCHTKIQTSASFTLADFDALGSYEDFTFEVEDASEDIPVDGDFPKVILFETGNGRKGAIKILNISPVGEVVKNEWYGSVTTETNPVVTFEMKTTLFPASIKLK